MKGIHDNTNEEQLTQFSNGSVANDIQSFFSSSKLRNFHSFGDVTNTGEGLQILTYARHSWSLSSEGSLACHTECYTGQLFIIGHLLGTVTLTIIAERLAVELSLPVLTT